MLITGASGLLGSNFLLHTQKRDMVAVYNQHPVFFQNARCIKADLTKKENVHDIFNAFNPSCIIHLAANTSLEYCELHPKSAEILHVDTTRSLAEIARGKNILMVYVSTDSVFDGARGNYTEEDVPNPQNQYAITKLKGEETVRHTCEKHLILRTNIFGWSCHNKDGLAEWILGELEDGHKIKGFMDVIFNPLLVNSVSEIISELVEKKVTGIYHLGSHSAISKYDFALLLAKSFNLNPSLIRPASIDSMAFSVKRPKNTTLCTGKIEKHLRLPLPDINKSIEYFKRLRDSGYVKKLKAAFGGAINETH